MFIDKARIYVRAGKGGNGCLSFRREKFVPYGGPNGGTGGKGGDIILQADSSLKTLYDFKHLPHYSAPDGLRGEGKNKSGASAENLILLVPCGTVVYKEGKFLADLIASGDKVVVAQGGRGGRGNLAFKSSRNRAPRIAEKGEPGEEAVIDLELKLIGDIAVVGYPNAGKSTFLSKVSRARPKVASYPFTTLSPNLGVARVENRDIVFADVPGLIEGAHQGKGLGFEFLRHIERTKLILHLVDIFGYENRSAKENFLLLNRELELYDAELLKKPMLVGLNKIDLPGAKEKIKSLTQSLTQKSDSKSRKKYSIFPLSALTGEGIKEICIKVVKILDSLPKEVEKEEQRGEYIFLPDFQVEKKGNVFCISGKKIKRLVAMTDFSQEEAVQRLMNIFKKMGLEKALIAQGVKENDTIKIGDFEFTYRAGIGPNEYDALR